MRHLPMLVMLLVAITLHASAIAFPKSKLATSSVVNRLSHKLGDAVVERSLRAEEGTSKSIDGEERVLDAVTKNLGVTEKMTGMLHNVGVSTDAEAPNVAKVVKVVETLTGAEGVKPTQVEKGGESVKGTETFHASKDLKAAANAEPAVEATSTPIVKSPNFFQRLGNKIKSIFAKILSWFRWKRSEPASQDSTTVTKEIEDTSAARVDGGVGAKTVDISTLHEKANEHGDALPSGKNVKITGDQSPPREPKPTTNLNSGEEVVIHPPSTKDNPAPNEEPFPPVLQPKNEPAHDEPEVFFHLHDPPTSGEKVIVLKSEPDRFPETGEGPPQHVVNTDFKPTPGEVLIAPRPKSETKSSSEETEVLMRSPDHKTQPKPDEEVFAHKSEANPNPKKGEEPPQHGTNTVTEPISDETVLSPKVRSKVEPDGDEQEVHVRSPNFEEDPTLDKEIPSHDPKPGEEPPQHGTNTDTKPTANEEVSSLKLKSDVPPALDDSNLPASFPEPLIGDEVLDHENYILAPDTLESPNLETATTDTPQTSLWSQFINTVISPFWKPKSPTSRVEPSQ
ncbi:hypothetical protein Plhal703r1_c07g0042081 [Plasmopara halstedii]